MAVRLSFVVTVDCVAVDVEEVVRACQKVDLREKMKQMWQRCISARMA